MGSVRQRVMRAEAKRVAKTEEPRRFPVVSPYDFRRTHSFWMESAGISRTRRRLYPGHGPQDVGDLYEGHEITAFLGEDRELLLAFLKQARGTLVKLA